MFFNSFVFWIDLSRVSVMAKYFRIIDRILENNLKKSQLVNDTTRIELPDMEYPEKRKIKLLGEDYSAESRGIHKQKCECDKLARCSSRFLLTGEP